MTDGWRSRGDRLVPLLLFVIALALRLHAAIAWNADHPNGPERLRYGDEPSYDGPARALLEEGIWFESPDRLPLYPLWLAFWHRITGFDYDVVVYGQAFLGAATVLLTWMVARRVASPAAAAVAAGAVAVSPVLIQQALHFIPAGMFTAALMLMALALVRAWKSPTAGRFAVAGLCVGLANLIRPTMLFFPLFVAAAIPFVIRSRRDAVRAALAHVLAAWLVTTPWTIRNYLVHDAFLPLSTSNATLWIGSPEYHRLVHEEGYTYERIWDEVIYPEDPAVPYPTTVEGEEYWSERAMRSIRRDPVLYARLVAERLVTFWVGDPVVDWGGHAPLSWAYLRARLGPADAAIRLLERALPLLLVVAVPLLWRRRRELLPLYVILVYATLLHAATVARVRMSDTFRPIVLVVLAAALMAAARRPEETTAR